MFSNFYRECVCLRMMDEMCVVYNEMCLYAFLSAQTQANTPTPTHTNTHTHRISSNSFQIIFGHLTLLWHEKISSRKRMYNMQNAIIRQEQEIEREGERETGAFERAPEKK